MLTPNQTFDQENGTQWPVYYDRKHPDGFTILTSAGNELLHDRDEVAAIRGLIHRYRAAEIGTLALMGEDKEIRQELGRGQEAVVYSMGPYAVREAQGISFFYRAMGELQRMDSINSVIEHGLPRWLNLPKHYALHVDPRLQKTYIMMEKVNAGTTVEDIMKYPEVAPQKAAAIESGIGEAIVDAQEKVPPLFEQAYEILAAAIHKSGRDPARYLTDWNPRNAIVEGRLSTPIAGSNYKLSVIDQYRS